MTLSLASLQHNFASALRTQASSDECDICDDHFSSQQRIQIYRNNFIIGLSEVLQATYPLVLALVGKECFKQLARQHILHHPLTEGDVSSYGYSFDITITQFPEVIKAAPYLTDVARFEWCMDFALQQHSAPKAPTQSLSLELLATVSAQQQANIQLQIEPSLACFESSFALFTLKSAIETNNIDGLNIHTPEAGIVWCNPQGVIHNASLSHSEYQLMSSLKAGLTLESISPALLTHLDGLAQYSIINGFTLLDNEPPPTAEQ